MEIEKEKMDSLKALVDINLKVSEARNLLTKLEEEETEYLVLREKKVMDRIKKTVDESKEMVEEANKNYLQIKELLNGINEFCEHVIGIQEKFAEIQETFNQRNELWEKNIGEQQDEVAGIKQEIKVHSKLIENDKKSLELSKTLIANQTAHIESQQASLLKSYEAEKALWDKMKKA